MCWKGFQCVLITFLGFSSQHPAAITKETSFGEEQLGLLPLQPQFFALPPGSGQHTAAAAGSRILPHRYVEYTFYIGEDVLHVKISREYDCNRGTAVYPIWQRTVWCPLGGLALFS